MDTQALIERLSADLERSRRDRRSAPRWSLGIVTLSSAVLVLGIVFAGLGARADLSQALISARGLGKFIAIGLVAALAFVALARSVEPGRSVLTRASALAAGGLSAAGLLWAWAAPVGTGAVWGSGDPLGCVLSILGLSLVPFAAVLWILRCGAPTRLGLTGGVAGILAGAVAAFGFAFACPVDMSPYVVVWYPTAIGLVGALGAGAGRYVLAW